MTSRGLQESHFEQIADMLHEVLGLVKDVQAKSGKLYKDWLKVVEADPRIAEIREKVERFAASFPMPGFEVGKVSNGKVHIAPAIGAKAPYSNGNHADVAESNGIKPTSAAGAVIS